MSARPAAAAILTVVDKEDEVRPPKLLANIRAPLMDADDIDLFSGEVRAQPTPVKVAPAEQPAPAEPDDRGNESREAQAEE